jgi:hypothetical protein
MRAAHERMIVTDLWEVGGDMDDRLRVGALDCPDDWRCQQNVTDGMTPLDQHLVIETTGPQVCAPSMAKYLVIMLLRLIATPLDLRLLLHRLAARVLEGEPCGMPGRPMGSR